jgi:hypothetical protein
VTPHPLSNRDRRARAAVVAYAAAALTGAAALAVLGPAPARADSITLNWTATGDDGAAGRATTYELRFSEQPVSGTDTTTWWNNASTAGALPPPLTSGSRESYVMSGLATGSAYYFVLRVADEAGNWSGFSNVRARQAGTSGGTLATPESFTASMVSGGVDLSWTEPSSGSGSGYHLYRRTGAGPDTLLTSLPVGVVGWCDSTAAGGSSYEYRLATYQGSGEGVPAVASIAVPSDRLANVTTGIHGYPNPARGRVTLRFEGGTKEGAPGRVRLVIYDLTGHMVCQLVDRVLPAGEQAIEWPCRSDAGNAVAPGLYNAILDAPQGRTVTRIAVVP